eukprot:jgi/Orpsp1_1/1186111/evm.model.c7180000096949.1
MVNEYDSEMEIEHNKNTHNQIAEISIDTTDILTDNYTTNEEDNGEFKIPHKKKKDKVLLNFIKQLKSAFSPFSSSQNIITYPDSNDETNSNESLDGNKKHKRCKSESNKIGRLNRAISKRKTYNSSTVNGNSRTIIEYNKEKEINNSDINSQEDTKQPLINTNHNESTNNGEQSSPLSKCFSPSDINENSMIDNTVPVTSTVNVVATATISSPTIEKTEQIENNNSDINTKNEKDSLIKNVNNSSETIDDSKTKNIVLCRICEEMILAENLGEHSKVCA